MKDQASNMYKLSSILSLLTLASAREITFAPVAAIDRDPNGHNYQAPFIAAGNIGSSIQNSRFEGLLTWGNLPYVHCLSEKAEDVEPFDIAILGAPFDTVCPARYPSSWTLMNT